MQGQGNLVNVTFEEQVVSACRTALGDSLRSVVYFTPEEYEQMYLRSDLEPDADLQRWVEHEATGFRAQLAYDGSELGEYQYTLRAFDNGLMTRVIKDDHGVFVTTDSITVRRSNEVSKAVGSLLE
jgi:hypothetical protein